MYNTVMIINRYFKVIILVVFVAIALIGLKAVDDGAIAVDDEAQRLHSLYSYEYINERLFGRSVPELGDYRNYLEYSGRNYGTFIQMPMVLIEDLNDFQLDVVEIYTMRHQFVFFFYLAALIFFYFLSKRLFSSLIESESRKRWISLAGVLMMFLFSRYFAASTYDVKNLAFSAFFIIALYFMVRFLQDRKWGPCILFCIFCAIAMNIRMAGLLLIPAILIFILVEDIVNRKSRSDKSFIQKLFPYIFIVIVCALVFYLITPAMWGEPIQQLKLMINDSVNFDRWDGRMIFGGELIRQEEMPWYYLPVWMGITIPVYILFFFILGTVFLVKTLIKERFAGFFRSRFFWLIWILFLIPLLLQIFGFVQIYGGWQHVYFLFVPLLLVAMHGIIGLYEVFEKQKTRHRFNCLVVPVIVIAGLIISGMQIATNYPFAGSLFNAIGTPIAKNFDRTARLNGELACLEYILKHFPDKELSIAFTQGVGPLIYFSGASEYDIERIRIVQDKDESTDFYWQTYRYIIGNTYEREGYTEVFSIWIDNSFKVGTLYIRDDFPLKQ